MAEKKTPSETIEDKFVITALVSGEVKQTDIGTFLGKIGKIGKIEKSYVINLNDYQFEEKIIEAIKKVDVDDV